MKRCARICSCPHLDDRRHNCLMWYVYLVMLILVWAWQGSFLIIAAASRIDVSCAVTYMRVRHVEPASDFEVVADFRQLNSSHTTGNVTVLADGNLTEGIAAERQFAVGTIHKCVYARNRRKLYYEPHYPPLRSMPSLIIHIVVFALLAVAIGVAVLQMRDHTSTNAASPRSLIVSHTDGSWLGSLPPIEMQPFREDDEEDIILFTAVETSGGEPPDVEKGAAVVN